MNETAVLVAIGAAVAARRQRPLLRGRVRTSEPRGVREERPVHPTAPDELAELELDRAMGRVSDADFEKWRGELEADLAPAGEPQPAPIDATARAEALIRQWRDVPRPTCPNCGLRPEPAARYCSNCGTALGA